MLDWRVRNERTDGTRGTDQPPAGDRGRRGTDRRSGSPAGRLSPARGAGARAGRAVTPVAGARGEPGRADVARSRGAGARRCRDAIARLRARAPDEGRRLAAPTHAERSAAAD